MKHVILMSLVMTQLIACKTNEFTAESERAAALPPLQSVEFTQLVREERQVQFKQGSAGSTGSESYSVTQKGIVDIVVVVDNSGSMQQEQANLATRMAPLLSSIGDSDWRILVTTTDPDDSYRFLGACPYSPIRKEDVRPDATFQNRVRGAGVNGDGIERPFLNAAYALTCNWGGSSWLRPNSTVAVVILTDEDNCHIDSQNGYGCSGQADADARYLIDRLSTVRRVGTDARVYGIFWHPSVASAQCPTALKQATRVAEAVQLTGGTWGSICDNDYSATLSKISRDVAQILKADFVLKSQPDNGTFRITVNGQPWSAYQLNGRNVRFTTNPPLGASISVSYRSGASGIVTNAFDMPEEPANGQLMATVNGQSVGGVSYDPNARKAVFVTRPADNSVVIVKYKASTPLRTTFNIAPNADIKHLKVLVNGSQVTSANYRYDASTGTMSFSAPPPEGAKIRIEWRGNKRSA
jgi:hypothetical protein